MIRLLSWFHLTPLLGHDQYGLLFEARQVLDGVLLYGPHLYEPNPPFVVWFSIIPVVIARGLHLPEIAAFRLVVTVMLAGSVLWSLRIARKSGRLQDSRGLLLLAAAILLVETPLRVLLFGQRENLLVICFLPYAIAIALDGIEALHIYERIALGVVAALGVCFKPHQVLLIVGIEIAVLASRRSFRHLLSPEVVSATITCVLYVIAIRVFAPRYLTDMVPLLVDTYWALGSHSVGYLALHQTPEMLGVAVIGVVALLLPRPLAVRHATACFLAAVLAASVAYDLQHTEWGYHLYPVLAFLAMAAAILLISVLHPLLNRFDAGPSPVLLLAMLVALGAAGFAEGRGRPDRSLPPDAGAFDGLQPGEPVYIFSTGAEVFPIADRRHLAWGSRYPALWMLPALLQNLPGGRALAQKDTPFKRLSPQRLAALSSMQRRELAEDLDYWKPRVVVVQGCPCDFIFDPHFDILAWFKQDADFQKSWSHYVEQDSPPGLGIYRRSR